MFTLSVASLQKLVVETEVIDWTSAGEAESGSITNGDPVAPEAVVDDWSNGGSSTQDEFDPLTEYPED